VAVEDASTASVGGVNESQRAAVGCLIAVVLAAVVLALLVVVASGMP
jgi:hypothetical protein